MENQHRLIKTYRDLSQTEIDLINEIKENGEVLHALIERVREHIESNPPLTEEAQQHDDIAQPCRWVSIARTDYQTAQMALIRAVAQPGGF